jgi:hypothetical protein
VGIPVFDVSDDDNDNDEEEDDLISMQKQFASCAAKAQFKVRYFLTIFY